MPVSVHQVNALLNRLIQQEFRPARTQEKAPKSNEPSGSDQVNISDSARTQQSENSSNLDEHLLALYTQRGRTRS